MTAPATGDFHRHLSVIGAALDRFSEFRHSDAFANADEWRDLLAGPLPSDGIGIEGVLAELTGTLIPNGSRISAPGFSGFITTGPTTAPVVAATASFLASPQRYTMTAFNFVEELSLEWLAELSGLDPAMKGVYVSGGSVGNLVALGAARQAAYEAMGIDVAAHGLGAADPVIYASTEVHHTVQRAAAVLGIGRSGVRLVPVDDHQRMVAPVLERMLLDDLAAGRLPIAVVATAGTTNTGAIDPISDIASIARAHGVWLHIDGAYGLLGHLDSRLTHLFSGTRHADSAIVDPHKWLAAPVGVAAVFVRDRGLLHRAFTQEPAEYLEGSFAAEDDVVNSMDSIGVPYGNLAVELSAPARGVQVWAIIREVGVEGIREFVVADNDLARLAATLADEDPNLESLIEPVLSIACVRHRGASDRDQDALNELNERILRRIVRETPYAPSATVVAGQFAIRPCYINRRTTTDDVTGLMEAIRRIGDQETDS